MKRPWLKFYPSDWRSDPRLRMCSLAARGLWIDLMSYMHEGEPYGHLTINGAKPKLDQIASLVGRPLREVEKAFAEIVSLGVCSSEGGSILSRRMVRDNGRSEEGREQVNKRWSNRDPNRVDAEIPNRSPTADPITQRLDTRDQIPEKIKPSCAVARATRPKPTDDFEEFWKAYPKRDGANPKAPARKAFLAAVKAGIEASEIVAGAGACAAKDRDKIGTPYIPQAVKWLRDRRWEDYSATAPPEPEDAPKGWRPGLPTHEELKRKFAENVSQSQGGDVLESGAGAHQDSQISNGDQARNGRVEGVGKLFSPSRIQAIRDGDGGTEPDEDRGVHGPGTVARVV